MTSAWLPAVGERIRPVETGAEAVSPSGDPIPAPGGGPHWARLRWPPKSNGDDRREAMVSDAERTTTLDPGSMVSGEKRTMSVVWEDGTEDDGLSPAGFGPCIDRPQHEENNEARAERARDARARGAARFRDGDDAAAATEYVESCALLASTLPSHALPAAEGGWNVPGYPTPVDAIANHSSSSPKSSPGQSRTAPTVGTRVRVMAPDGSSRSGMVSYVETDDDMCDVMFDETNDGEDDEEVGVPFVRLFGYDAAARHSCAGEHDEDEDTRRTRREAAARDAESAAQTCDELASRLLDLARCHLRMSGGGTLGVGKDGKMNAWVPAHTDAASARACVSACDAALAMRRTRAGYYLRGRARVLLCAFTAAGDDLKTALELRTVADGGGANDGASGDVQKRPEASEHDIASEREVKLALRALRAAAKHRRASDRRLAKAIIGHVDESKKDFRLDPGSELETTGRVLVGGPYLRPPHERKHDAVDVNGLKEIIKEKVAERVKRGCVVM